MAKNALVPTADLVQPTPVYEFLFSVALCWVLWQFGKRSKPVGWMTGVYLVLSGVGRFLVEFVRINPRIYWGMSNAQVAAWGRWWPGCCWCFGRGLSRCSGLLSWRWICGFSGGKTGMGIGGMLVVVRTSLIVKGAINGVLERFVAG